MRRRGSDTGSRRGASVPEVCLLHTVAGLPPVFDRLLAEQLPGVHVSHLVDETLLADAVERGVLPRTRRRVVDHVAHAELTGADAVLVTCSSIGEAAEQARRYAAIPVCRIDAPMARQAAVHPGGRIAVLATLESTLGPTRRLIEQEAAAAGRAVTVHASVCPGAFAALRAGDTDRHDRVVADEAARLARDADVLVLAQASMARIVSAQPGVSVPVLSSPGSGVHQLVDVLDGVR